jgi:hypothetical protein
MASSLSPHVNPTRILLASIIIRATCRSGSCTIALDPTNHQILLGVLNRNKTTVHVDLETLIIWNECWALISMDEGRSKVMPEDETWNYCYKGARGASRGEPAESQYWLRSALCKKIQSFMGLSSRTMIGLPFSVILCQLKFGNSSNRLIRSLSVSTMTGVIESHSIE